MINLNESEPVNSITSWLDENLKDVKSIIPHIDKIPNINLKGIYFWFMKTDGYEELSKFITINPIEPGYSKTIDGVKYDLVYLGTSGTGKQGNSTIHFRLKWHIEQKHREKTICQKQSALSTLRTGLGSLLSDDLILTKTENSDTESLVNTFMEGFLKVFWVEYSDKKSLIDNDEKALIKVLRPLLNLKNNPYALKKVENNPTKSYKIRRNLIENNTKVRIGKKDNN